MSSGAPREGREAPFGAEGVADTTAAASAPPDVRHGTQPVCKCGHPQTSHAGDGNSECQGHFGAKEGTLCHCTRFRLDDYTPWHLRGSRRTYEHGERG